MNPLITWFPKPPAAEDIPAVIPSPFATSPHPLAAQAALMLQQRLTTQGFVNRDFHAIGGGKMFGVLVVRDQHTRIGFIASFSGMMNGNWLHEGFVPPLFDQAALNRFTPAARAELEALAQQQQEAETRLQQSPLTQQILALQQQRDRQLAELKLRHKAARAERKQQRLALAGAPATERERRMAELALASQRHKRESINATNLWRETLQGPQQQLTELTQEIARIRATYAEKLRQLHKDTFATYRLHNRMDESQIISTFFAEGMPPAGAGDCAAPKLIHYAVQHRLQPLALAEFWWGASPAAGIRHHGHFYPACRGKCRPILPFMLRGLELEPHPDFAQAIDAHEPQTVYEDEYLLVINKPAGLMSTPGKHIKDSVQTRLLQRYPQHPELKLVHRLDMGTSGLLLVAKTLPANKRLQRQFVQRSVEKQYEALLSKPLSDQPSEGEIDLPLRTDYEDTPRQMVCLDSGKPALTRWKIIGRERDATRICFYPHTGRTHQLRIHAAHRDGLNAAIVGDELYGLPGERMMLHARRLCFTHPFSRERMAFEAPAPF